MAIIDIAEYEKENDLDNVTKEYREFRDKEGIPVHTGLHIDDWTTVETDKWSRTGQQGAFLNLYGAEGVNDMQVHELSPKGKTKIQHHLYEEIVYVAKGDGFTVVGQGENEVTFEWKTHSLFFIPPNTPYYHVNASDDQNARLIAETPLPQLLTMFRNEEMLFDPDNSAWDEYYKDDFFSAETEVARYPRTGKLSWLANFIPDIKNFDKLEDNPYRGLGGTSTMRFPLPQTSMYSHISEMPVGTYKKAHRHHPGANVSVLRGEGYSLFWLENWEDKVRIDWSPGTVFTPPALWYHQHFNTSDEPARYFAMHGPQLGTLREQETFNSSYDGNQIEYIEEEKEIRELYREELNKNGIDFNMPPDCYTNPDYQLDKSDPNHHN